MGRNQAKKQATSQPTKAVTAAAATGNKRPLVPTSGKAAKRGKFEPVQRGGRYEESDDEEVDEDDEEDQEEDEDDEDENDSEEDEEGDSEGEDEEDGEEEGSDDGFRPAEGYAVGIDAGTQYPGDIEALQSLMYESELNFICLDLNHAAPLLDQLSLDSGEINSVIMGKLDLPAVEASQWSSVEKNVFSQYAFAAHMGLQAVLIKIPSSAASDSWQLMQICRMITNMLSKFPPTSPQLWIRIPMDQWHLWDAIRHGIDHHTHVFLALDTVEVTNGAKVFEEQGLRRWLAEPIKAVLLDSEHLLGSDTTPDAPVTLPKDKKTKGKGPASSTGAPRKLVTKFIPSEEMVVDFLRTFFDFKMHFIIVPASTHKIPNNPESFMDSEALTACLYHLQEQFAMWRETPLAEDEEVAESLLLDQNFSFSFRDKLQTPLDPLHQNLDLETYRVMEEDPIKYQRYEMALIAATRDLKKMLGKAVSPTTPLRILVVGPGRGPLIASSLVASAVNQVPVEVIAIEKNPNAVRTLRHRFAQFITEPTTHNRVRVIEGDMRDRVVPSNAGASSSSSSSSEQEDRDANTIGVGSVHIIVSELLGSFADNEASPECLYAIEHALHPRHGIMIPQSYTSYLVPVAASSLWQQARTMFSHHGGKNQFQQQGLDYPYVVHLHSHATYGGAAQPVFQFVHPSHAVKDIHVPTATSLFPATSSSSASTSASASASAIQKKIITLGNQSRHVSFVMDQAATLHGVAGYFHCTLYKDIVFSTVPEQIGTLSPGMFSWFPMYFPMTHPVSVRAGDEIDVYMWRCVDGDRMWYEWSIRPRSAVASPVSTTATTATTAGALLAAVQNTLGRAFHVQL